MNHQQPRFGPKRQRGITWRIGIFLLLLLLAVVSGILVQVWEGSIVIASEDWSVETSNYKQKGTTTHDIASVSEQGEPTRNQPRPILTGHRHRHNNNETTTTTTTEFDCSCWNSSAPKRCCIRNVLISHKMGSALFWNILYAYRPLIPTVTTSLSRKVHDFLDAIYQHNNNNNPNDAFRFVVPIRNFYDALISGYLYHQSGKECWLNMYGQPTNHSMQPKATKFWSWEEEEEEEESLSKRQNTTNNSLPPRNYRSICQYLADESEHNGMSVFIRYSFHLKWQNLLPLYQQSILDTETYLFGNVGFVCYEDLVHPQSRQTALQQVVDFLYPHHPNNNNNKNKKKKSVARFDQQHPHAQEKLNHENGGHATSNDVSLRNRLHGIIEQLDDQIFHGLVSHHQSIFQCGQEK